MSDYLDINNEELLKDFFSEAEQQVFTLESNILVIENDPTNKDAIDEIFRAAHTLKGGAATVEMQELAGFTHVVEDLLDVIRSGSQKITEHVVNVLLESLDVIKLMLDARSSGSIYNEDVDDLKDQLQALIPSKDKKTQKTAVKKAVDIPAVSVAKQHKPIESFSSRVTPSQISDVLSEYELLELKESIPANTTVFLVKVSFDESNLMNTVGGIQVFASLKQTGQVLKTHPDFDALYEDVFHEQVVYFVASDVTEDELKKAAYISDVTLDIEVAVLDLSDNVSEVGIAVKADPAVQKAQAPLEQTQVKHVESAPVSVSQSVSESIMDSDHDEQQDVEVTQNEEKPSSPKKVPQAQSSHSAGSILRVDSRRIDFLLNLVSETVITKASFNQNAIQFSDLLSEFQQIENSYKGTLKKLLDSIPDYIEKAEDGLDVKDITKEITTEYAGLFEIFTSYHSTMKSTVSKFRSASQNLGRITGELQEGVMKIRMVPISQIFSRFPRLVRDLSKDLHKNIQLIVEGEDTELDKSVVEDLLDPIMHCVRNAVDHGIETAEERTAQGKNPTGTILLKASNEGNMIIIEISDDGKGLNKEAIRNKAVSRGLIHPDKNLTDIETYELIFKPGFSTAEKISNVSGRGVGLDVVRTHIEKLNGTVSITSQPGLGSRFTIRLPLTLAIIQGLLIKVGKEVYSIPITSVIESHRVKQEEISRIDNYEVFNVRNEVISLLRLNRLFGIKSNEQQEYNYIVIVGTAEKKVGLMVDSLIGEEDVVIKPLRDQFTNSPGIAGASILGDGSVSLIIDVSQLLDLGLRQEMHAREMREASVW